MSVVVKRRERKFPLTPDGSKVSYLLLHLSAPSDFYPPSTNHLRTAKRAANDLGIKLSTIVVEAEKSMGPGQSRYLFHFPYYRRNDKLASRFADTVLIAASVIHGPFLDRKDDLSSFRIPMNLIRNRKNVYLGELIQVEEARQWSERITEFPTSIIGSSTQFSPYSVETAWKLTPLLFNNEKFLHAFRFLKTSQENFHVWPGQIDEAVEDAHVTAENVFQQSRLENALQDSFKAVEAIIGDPPKNDDKFLGKIKSFGIDPNMIFGLEDKPIHQVIRDMNDARDKKAAHGSTQNRAITVGELLVFQNCARFIALHACESQLGERL